MPSCRCPHTGCSLSVAGWLQRRVLAVAAVKLTAAAVTSGGGQGRGRSCRRRLPQHPAVDEPPLPVQCLCAGFWLRLPPRRREPPLRRNQLTDWGRAALPPIAAAGRVSLAAICRLSDPGALVPAAALATPDCRGSPLPAAHRLRSSRARSRSFQRMALMPGPQPPNLPAMQAQLPPLLLPAAAAHRLAAAQPPHAWAAIAAAARTLPAPAHALWGVDASGQRVCPGHAHQVAHHNTQDRACRNLHKPEDASRRPGRFSTDSARAVQRARGNHQAQHRARGYRRCNQTMGRNSVV